MKRLVLLLLVFLLLAGCEIVSTEGLVTNTYTGSLGPIQKEPCTIVWFSDGRVYGFKGLSPQPVEKDRYQKIFYEDSLYTIKKVEVGTATRPPVPGEEVRVK
jgi:hypothetical protein